MQRIRVMISSTQKDLRHFRNAVQKVALSLGLEILRAESYTAPGKSPIETCKEMAETCDIYIGIFGYRYGTIDPTLKISITNFEYQVARTHNPRKVLIYIRKAKMHEPRQKKFLRQVQLFHDGYFRHQYFGTAKELREQIRNDLIAWIAEKIHIADQAEKQTQSLILKVEQMQKYYQQIAEIQRLPKEILL